MGGGSKKQTVGYKYSAGMHLVLGVGVADKILRLKVADRIIYESNEAAPVIDIDEPTAFGGTAREGGVVGRISILDGSPTQQPNSYLQTKIGSAIPAFRGVVSAILEHVYIGNNPYLKKWAFRVQRIHQTSSGEKQWYDEKSSLVIGDPTATEVLNETEMFDIVDGPGGAVLSSSMGPFSNGDLNGVEPEVPVGPPLSASNSPWPLGDHLFLRKTFITTQFNTSVTLVGAIDDGCQILLDGVLIADLNYNAYLHQYSQNSPIRNFITTISNLEAGSHTLEINCSDWPYDSTANYIGVRITRTPYLYESMNPAHIIRECLSDKNWGLGLADEDIDDASFTAAADTLYDEKLFMDIAWRKQSTIDKFIKEVNRHINAEVYADKITGLFKIKLIRDDYNIGSLITLDESNITKLNRFSKPAFGDLVNSVTVNYYNLELGSDASVTVQDIGLIAEQGNTIDKTFTYSGFSTKELALAAAKRELRAISSELASCKLVVVSTVAAELNLGDVFVLSWADYGIASMVMRVTSLNLGTDKKGSVTIEGVQDVFSTPVVAEPTEDVSFWRDYQSNPIPTTDFKIFEVPYFELIQTISETSVRSLLADNPNAGYVGMAARRPEGGLSANLYTNSGGGFEEVGAIDFCPSATLIAAIDESSTVFQVNNVDDVASVRLGSWFQIEDELLSIEGFANGTTLTVKRGVLDTLPASHPIGANVLFWDEFAEGDPTEYIESDAVSTRLATVSSGGTIGIELSPEKSVVLRSRAARPYPAGNVQINGNYFPSNVEGDVVVTWSSRNRLLQTSGILLGWTEGNITPEVGTTYNVRLKQGETVIHSDDGITALTTTFTGVVTGVYDLEITVIRDSLESYFIFLHQFSYATIDAESIASSEIFGNPITGSFIEPTGVTTEEAVGSAVIANI